MAIYLAREPIRKRKSTSIGQDGRLIQVYEIISLNEGLVLPDLGDNWLSAMLHRRMETSLVGVQETTNLPLTALTSKSFVKTAVVDRIEWLEN